MKEQQLGVFMFTIQIYHAKKSRLSRYCSFNWNLLTTYWCVLHGYLLDQPFFELDMLVNDVWLVDRELVLDPHVKEHQQVHDLEQLHFDIFS